MRTFDHARMGRAFRTPEKQWVSMGTVDPETPDSPSVTLVGDSDGPLDTGPMVNVTLQPSGISLPCRVASQVAGQGEADYYPFVAGDEVIVLIPEGHERAGGVITGRMNQSLDTWPSVVAGQDATKNKFGFRRMRTPYIVETAASYLIRNATTGSQIGLDDKGQVIVSDGDKNSLTMGAEQLGFQSGDGNTFATLFPPTQEVYLGAGTTTFDMTPTGSKFLSNGPITFATNSPGVQSGVSAEQVVALIINLLAQLATMSAFTSGPLGPSYLALPSQQAQQALLASIVSPVLLAMGGVVPVGPAPGGEFAEFLAEGVFGPAGALGVAMANPVAGIDVTGFTTPGFGKSGFKL